MTNLRIDIERPAALDFSFLVAKPATRREKLVLFYHVKSGEKRKIESCKSFDIDPEVGHERKLLKQRRGEESGNFFDINRSQSSKVTSHLKNNSNIYTRSINVEQNLFGGHRPLVVTLV